MMANDGLFATAQYCARYSQAKLMCELTGFCHTGMSSKKETGPKSPHAIQPTVRFVKYTETSNLASIKEAKKP